MANKFIITAAVEFADARQLFLQTSCYINTVNRNPDINPQTVLNELGAAGAPPPKR